MINIKERIEIILNKSINQVGLLQEDRSNAVVIGYDYNEFGGIIDDTDQKILEWNLADTQPTIKQLKAITDSQIEEHKKKAFILPACKQYLLATDFKMASDYDKDVSDIKIIRDKCRQIIRQIEDLNTYPSFSDIPKEIDVDKLINLR